MAGVANLFSDKVVNKKGESVDLQAHCAGKVVGIYFSAHWCPPCRGFTPVLAEFYNKHHEAKNFEVIFVSSDRDQDAFNDYYSSMPWLTLNFKERQLKETLASKYGIRGIPTLILINADSGDVITGDGRTQIQSNDPEGKEFPWKK